ncbi:hypothetical protein ACIPK7_22685 [Pseudomonas sp. NPDC086581]|uniref:hypothetical protein n=1 Tax=Pseudomonas sp. NPDC086581 TaxID=3364432 RepID=UPI0037F392D4
MIDIEQVLQADKYLLKTRSKLGRKRNLQNASRELFLTGFSFPEKRTGQFLFFRSLERADYKMLFNGIASAVPEEDRIVVEDFVRPSQNSARRAFVLLFTLLPLFFMIRADSLFERAYLYLRLCYYYRVVKAISTLKFDNLILFSDMQPVECLLAQYFRRRGKNTVTLQHGLYADYGSYPTINVINYLHQPSEYFLAWGRDTAQLIYRSGENRKVVICGKPSVALASVARSNVQISAGGDIKYFTLVLDQNIFQTQNVEMLKVLSEYSKSSGLAMNVRYHPGNNRKIYEGLGYEYLSDLDLSASVFVVGHTSSMMHEMLLVGLPVFKFDSDIPCVKMPSELVFSSVEQLRGLLEKAEHVDFGALAKDYIAFFGDESLKRYRDFFFALKKGGHILLD